MPYTDQQEYAKHLKQKCLEENCGGDCHGCNDCQEEDCGCCPPGLIAVYDSSGNHSGCLTPNDAELYDKAKSCPPGTIKLFNGDVYIGCVSEENYATILAALNPVV